MAPTRYSFSLYGVLELRQTATEEEIKDSYRRLARQLHPDKNLEDATATRCFQRIQTAHTVLRDAKQRQKYDQTLPSTRKESPWEKVQKEAAESEMRGKYGEGKREKEEVYRAWQEEIERDHDEWKARMKEKMPSKKGRAEGRKRKVEVEEQELDSEIPRKRAHSSQKQKSVDEKKEVVSTLPRKKGRPRKIQKLKGTSKAKKESVVPPRKRGRPRKERNVEEEREEARRQVARESRQVRRQEKEEAARARILAREERRNRREQESRAKRERVVARRRVKESLERVSYF